ncbi:hypothetical protein V1520DRAFT_46624 [Lipomyces starkeyi]|uniref:Uncharacterized protein n=1 Tax=Lipomyces starkeyi NRRL Y-11557 TaxID=675824 RepID=A0A1E3Q6Z5_LIPST|nr:hypothetical protein LIPSTDRAFT_291158 [Lipomyces starkeyi NRRL Y-11557]
MLCTAMVNIGAARSYFMAYVITLQEPDMFNQSFINFGFKFVMNISFIFLGLGFAGVLRGWVVFKKRCGRQFFRPWLSIAPYWFQRKDRILMDGRFPSTSSFGQSWLFRLSGSSSQSTSSRHSETLWITWIAPDNLVLAIICGSSLGLGFNPISTFDRAVVDVSTPLVVPFFSIANHYHRIVSSPMSNY